MSSACLHLDLLRTLRQVPPCHTSNLDWVDFASCFFVPPALIRSTCPTFLDVS